MVKKTGRGCGNMKYNTVYATWSLSQSGTPLTWYIIDPQVALNQEKMRISAQGMNILPKIGQDGKQVVYGGQKVFDVYDVVGRNHYPFIADFWEEAKRFGVSRVWPKDTPLSGLIPGMSKHIFCTHAAVLENTHEVIQTVNHYGARRCLKLDESQRHPLPFADNFEQSCSAMWYSHMTKKDAKEVDGLWVRNMPSFRYSCEPVEHEQKFKFGAFMWLPLGNFVGTHMKNGQLDSTMEKTLEGLQKAGFTVETVNLDDDDA